MPAPTPTITVLPDMPDDSKDYPTYCQEWAAHFARTARTAIARGDHPAARLAQRQADIWSAMARVSTDLAKLEPLLK